MKLLDELRAYVDRVLSGELVRCRAHKKACKRFLNWLDERRYIFSEEAAGRALRFMSHLRFTKGEWRGRTFELEPWQRFIVANLFGWLREDGLRVFRTASIWVPRKNGKSELGAAIGLYLAFGDGEPAAEVYSAATKRDQARIVFDQAKEMVRLSGLHRHVGIHQANLHQVASASKFEPLASDTKTLDGLNVHGAIVDEVHAHRNREVLDLLDTATGARRQPMIVQISTAGVLGESIGREQYEYANNVLDGVVDDPTFFADVHEIDPEDDWRDEDVWAKANPNLGVSVKIEDLRRKAIKAKAVPAAQNAFRRLHLNEWTEQANRWLDLEAWDACKVHPWPDLRGRVCWAGLDLSSTLDLTALALIFDTGHVMVRAWCPRERIIQRSREDGVPYLTWAQHGLLTATDGRTVDYAFVRADINRLREEYRIVNCRYDRWNASQLVRELESDGLEMVPFGQGFGSMAAPCAELERLIESRELKHNGDPVLRWAVSNVAVELDPAGNKKPAKNKSREKIDPVVALIMAIAGRMAGAEERGTIYDQRGLIVV